MSYIFIYIFCLFCLIVSCKNGTELNFETTVCEKIIKPAGQKFDRDTLIGFTHNGFCYNDIDSLNAKIYLLKKQNEKTDSSTLNLSYRKLKIPKPKSTNTEIWFSIGNFNKPAQYIQIIYSVLYKNKSRSNVVTDIFEAPCPRQIYSGTYTFISKNTCQTAAGDGDRYSINYYHKGFCVSNIDSAGGYGEFMDNDGYIWSTSYFSRDYSGLNIQYPDSFITKISQNVCITWRYADKIKVHLWVKYKDKTKSNELIFEIPFTKRKTDEDKNINNIVFYNSIQ